MSSEDKVCEVYATLTSSVLAGDTVTSRMKLLQSIMFSIP